MYTQWDKAIVALVMSVIFILTSLGVAVPEWANETVLTTLIGAITPLLVYFIPNKGFVLT